MKARTLECLQAGRALAALGVVLFHTGSTINLPKYWGVYPFMIFHPGYTGVFFFFVLSGYIILAAHHRDIGAPDRLARYARNRVFRIYPAYWIVTVVAVAAMLALKLKMPNDPTYYIGAFSLLPIKGYTGFLEVAWSLFHEIVFYIIFALIIANRRAGLAGLAVWALGCVLSMAHPFGSAAIAVILAPVNLLFFLGMATYLASGKIAQTRRAIWAICAGVLGYGILWGADIMGYRVYLPAEIGFGVASALIILGAVKLEQENRLKIPRALTVLGDASYSIYLIHFLVISGMAKLLHHFGAISAKTAFFLLAAPAIAAGLIFYLAIERPILAWARRKPAPAVRPLVQN